MFPITQRYEILLLSWWAKRRSITKRNIQSDLSVFRCCEHLNTFTLQTLQSVEAQEATLEYVHALIETKGYKQANICLRLVGIGQKYSGQILSCHEVQMDGAIFQ